MTLFLQTSTNFLPPLKSSQPTHNVVFLSSSLQFLLLSMSDKKARNHDNENNNLSIADNEAFRYKREIRDEIKVTTF
jgi:hypothetical protein